MIMMIMMNGKGLLMTVWLERSWWLVACMWSRDQTATYPPHYFLTPRLWNVPAWIHVQCKAVSVSSQLCTMYEDMGWVRTRLPTAISSALDERSQLHARSTLAPKEINSIAHCIGSWLDRRSCVHARAQR